MPDYKQDIGEFIESMRLKYGYIPKFAHNQNPDNKKIFYAGPNFDNKELIYAIEALLFSQWSVNGEKVREFEDKNAEIVGDKYAAACNSGSSANLALITACKDYFKWDDGDNIACSPVGFPTTISPICQNNLKVNFVDIEWDTLNFDLNLLEKKINSRTKAVFLSPVLGNPVDMDRLKDICERNDLVLLGDFCDSFGSKWKGINLNKYVVASTNSQFSAHHFSTLNGGLISTDNGELITLVRGLISWNRDCYCRSIANLLPNGTCKKRFSKWLPDYDGIIDHKYVFNKQGYNLQQIDILAAIGLAQLEKVEQMEIDRRKNFYSIKSWLENSIPNIYIPIKLAHSDPSWFGVPIVCDNKEVKQKLVAYFEKNNIQTRNYFAGNLLLHGGFKHLDDWLNYPNATATLDRVFFLGCWSNYSESQLAYIEKVISNYGK